MVGANAPFIVKSTEVSWLVHRPSLYTQVERKSRALDKKTAKMQAEARDEAKEGLKRDALESREALRLVVGGGDSDADEEEGEEGIEGEVVPPQVLKERIESVIEVLSDFQVGTTCIKDCCGVPSGTRFLWVC